MYIRGPNYYSSVEPLHRQQYLSQEETIKYVYTCEKKKDKERKVKGTPDGGSNPVLCRGKSQRSYGVNLETLKVWFGNFIFMLVKIL